MQILALSAAKGTPPLISMLAVNLLSASTLVHWNFDSGVAGLSLAAIPAVDVSGQSHLLHGYDEILSPVYSSDTFTGSGLSVSAADQDGYSLAPVINEWAPSTWTIEISVKYDRFEGWNTLIGRDGTSWPGNVKSDFYLQTTDADRRFRLDFATADGSRYTLDSTFNPEVARWYHLALVCDDQKVSMYVDSCDGRGYQLEASKALIRKVGANHSLATTGANWTFGRGWYAGRHVDNISGRFDDIRFTEGALTPEQFLHAKRTPEPGYGFAAALNGRDVIFIVATSTTLVQRMEVRRSVAGGSLIQSQLVATLMPPLAAFIDLTPDADVDYQYWLNLTHANGSVVTAGPIISRAGSVWTP